MDARSFVVLGFTIAFVECFVARPNNVIRTRELLIGVPPVLFSKRTLKKARGGSSRGSKSRRPRLIVFDLDGCLWRPELFEIATCPRDARGPPFATNPKDVIPGTTLKNAGGTHTVELLGDTRTILYQLYSEEQWYPSLVGISSRTDPAEWAQELLATFSIFDPNNDSQSTMIKIPMKDIFTEEVCILDKAMDKATQFERLVDRANRMVPVKLRYKDVMFFDNEAGNCKQVAKLGVTCVYTPKGMTLQAWENGLANFPYSRGVLGPKLPY